MEIERPANQTYPLGRSCLLSLHRRPSPSDRPIHNFVVMSELVDRLNVALSDRYTIERELGSGGMAQVFLAEDRKHHRHVAVKVLRPDLAAALGAQRFLRELEDALARGHAEGGHRTAIRRAAETWAARSHRSFVPPVDLAELFATAGEHERALEWLERGFEQRDPNMPFVDVQPHFDGLHDDPRFQDLLQRMNLPTGSQ